MAQLTCENLTLGYEGREIVKGLSFSVSSGDYLCIVGENGSGKSTLMKTVLGLQAPISGRVITGDGLRQNEIGYLPQQTEVQKDFPASVREIVLSGCQGRSGLRPFYNRAEKALADAAMAKMGISGLRNRCYRELSGGQQQRVLLSRALCATRKMLLLDEPVSGLDPRAGSEMYRIIAELNKNDGITIVMISHDVSAATQYASHILHIGKTLFWGTTKEYLESDLALHLVGDEPDAGKRSYSEMSYANKRSYSEMSDTCDLAGSGNLGPGGESGSHRKEGN